MNEHEFDKIIPALLKAQSEFPSMGKDTEGYNYSYLSLPALIKETTPILTQNGLCVFVTIRNDEEENSVAVKTTLAHVSGQTIESDYGVTPKGLKMNDLQMVGTAITYLRRYQLQGLLNVCAEEDDDGAKSNVSGSKKTSKPPSAKREKEMTDKGKEIKAEIDACESVDSVDSVISERKDDLDKIKKHNEKWYNKLIAGAGDKKLELQSAAVPQDEPQDGPEAAPQDEPRDAVSES